MLNMHLGLFTSLVPFIVEKTLVLLFMISLEYQKKAAKIKSFNKF